MGTVILKTMVSQVMVEQMLVYRKNVAQTDTSQICSREKSELDVWYLSFFSTPIFYAHTIGLFALPPHSANISDNKKKYTYTYITLWIEII